MAKMVGVYFDTLKVSCLVVVMLLQYVLARDQTHEFDLTTRVINPAQFQCVCESGTVWSVSDL